MAFHGAQDPILKTVQGKLWTERLKWSGQGSFNLALAKNYMVNGQKKGKLKEFGGLIMITVDNSGNRVLETQPEVSLEMLKKLTSASLRT